MSQEIIGWQCEKCLQIYPSKTQADDCCANNECKVCVYKRITIGTTCATCPDKNYFKWVEAVIPYSEYQGAIFHEYLGRFPGKETLLEYIVKNCPAKGQPSWCYGAVETTFRIDIEEAILSAMSLMDDDFKRSQIADFKELICFIKKWNKKQTATTSVIDPTLVVLLNE